MNAFAEIPVRNALLHGDLAIPAGARLLVLFAHGSGSSRKSPRNRFAADTLNAAGIATLLFDLLTAGEEAVDARTAELRFNIPLLAERLHEAAEWAKRHPDAGSLPLGFFGSSTGAGAALIAAAEFPERIAAVVSRGGRPDLAGASLARVKAPTLLIVGGEDRAVIDLNREAMEDMQCPKELLLIPGATHLFEEPGTLEQAAEAAAAWFLRHAGAEGPGDIEPPPVPGSG